MERYPASVHSTGGPEVQNVGVGVDAMTVRSALREELNHTQLLPVQSREKSAVSSLIRDPSGSHYIDK